MYLVFAFDGYYPAGGWNDFVGAFDTLSEAVTAGVRSVADYYQVVSTDSKTIVSGGITERKY